MHSTLHPHYWFIELLAWWEGRLQVPALQQHFGISRQAASRYLSQYKETYPAHLNYNTHLKHYEPTTGFRPQFLSGDVSEYLNWLIGNGPAPTGHQISYQTIRHPPRVISPRVIRPIVTALRQCRRLDVDYLSITSADSEGRIIVPHTLVNTGLRWHVRAWCEKSSAYRDFVLSRFRDSPELMDQSDQTAEKDTDWQTHIDLQLQPDPRLSQAKRQVLEADYQMQNGQLVITTRAALAQYTLQDLQVSTKTLDGNPEAQQLVLANYEDVKQWLF